MTSQWMWFASVIGVEEEGVELKLSFTVAFSNYSFLTQVLCSFPQPYHIHANQ